MPTLGLAMIVKNGAQSLRNCLASVAGLVDHIVVADTGSTDGTPQLARDLGAEVFDLAWPDDFAKARNAAVAKLTTDWVLILDDDEELDTQAREKIPSLLVELGVGGYLATLRNYLPVILCEGGHAPSVRPLDSPVFRAENARSFADFDLCRLFRRHPRICYSSRVHESVDSSIHALGLRLASGDFLIHHFGHLSCSAEELQEKDRLYRKLSHLKCKDAPNNSQAWIEWGLVEYERFRNYSVAIECFKKALALDPKSNKVPYLSLANLYLEIHAEDRALELLSRVTMKGRQEGDKERICGDALYNLGRLKESRAAYLRALAILRGEPRILSKLGLTEVRLWLKKSGLSRLKAALKAAPDQVEMHDRMIKAFLVMNLLPQAAETAERVAAGLPNPANILRAAVIRAQMWDWAPARSLVKKGLQMFPNNQELLAVSAELEKKTRAVAV
jgi:glycosyltransferase involved in cell wall biosynthesis